MVMGYDSTMEWVVGTAIPKPKITQQAKPLVVKTRRSRPPRRRLVVHVETSESDISPSSSEEEKQALVQKRVHFEEPKTPKLKSALKKENKKQKADKTSAQDNCERTSDQDSESCCYDCATQQAQNDSKSKSGKEGQNKSNLNAAGHNQHLNQQGKFRQHCQAHLKQQSQQKPHHPTQRYIPQSQNLHRIHSAHQQVQGEPNNRRGGPNRLQAEQYNSQVHNRDNSRPVDPRSRIPAQGGTDPLPYQKMTSRVIQPSRGDVVLREDVIECTTDPRPNAFFDAKTGVLRVYHGPVYGNPFATLVPLPANQMAIGTFPPHAGQFVHTGAQQYQHPHTPHMHATPQPTYPPLGQNSHQRNGSSPIRLPPAKDGWVNLTPEQAAVFEKTGALPGAWVDDTDNQQSNPNNAAGSGWNDQPNQNNDSGSGWNTDTQNQNQNNAFNSGWGSGDQTANNASSSDWNATAAEAPSQNPDNQNTGWGGETNNQSADDNGSAWDGNTTAADQTNSTANDWNNNATANDGVTQWGANNEPGAQDTSNNNDWGGDKNDSNSGNGWGGDSGANNQGWDSSNNQSSNAPAWQNKTSPVTSNTGPPNSGWNGNQKPKNSPELGYFASRLANPRPRLDSMGNPMPPGSSWGNVNAAQSTKSPNPAKSQPDWKTSLGGSKYAGQGTGNTNSGGGTNWNSGSKPAQGFDPPGYKGGWNSDGSRRNDSGGYPPARNDGW